MDGTRFDLLTRRFTSSWSSRRQLLRGLAAPGLAAFLMAERPPTMAKRRRKRKRCRKAGQTCVSFGKSLGKCCKHSSCQEVPQNQSKFCLCNPGYSDANRTGHCSPVVCATLGEECASTETCCPLALGSGLRCAPILGTKGPRGCSFLTQTDAPSRCCLGEGGSICTGDCDCCDNLTCQNGRCQPPQPVCRSLGEGCTAQAECCGGESNRVGCERIDSTKARGGCGPSFLGNRCCTEEGWQCSDTCECCGGMACINGTCFYSAPGQECQDTVQCLAGTCETVEQKPDNSCLIPANQPPPRLCCFQEDDACSVSCECCGTLTCQDSVCSSFLSR